MRKQTWIRFGLSSVMLASGATACLAVGCSDDDNAVVPVTDGGHVDGTTFGDGGNDTGPLPDTGTTEGGGDGGLKHAKIIAVHASPNAPDLRFCFKVGVKADGSDGAVGPLPALPHDDKSEGAGRNYPALYAGFGGAFPDLTDLEPKALTPIVIPMNAANIATLATDVKSNPNERTCDALVGNMGQGGVLATTAFFTLPTIPLSTFVKGNTYLLALTGCLGGDMSQSTTGTDGKAKCGADYVTATPSGNISLKIVKLDKTVADAAKLGLSVLHLSSASDGFIQLGSFASPAPFDLGVKTTFGLSRDDLDGGPPPNPPVAIAVNYGYGLDGGTATPETYANADYAHALAYAAITGLHTVPANPDAGTDASVAVIPAKTIPIPFGNIQVLSYGFFGDAGAPGPTGVPLYVAGQNYTLIYLGDPTAAHQLVMTVDGGGVVPDPQYDGHGLHFMMFPNDPPLPSL